MNATLSWSWVLLVAGAMIALSGAGLAVWALFHDRARGRRRCPKCWYDMSGAPPHGMKCPECGREQMRERRFFRTRRRWRWAGAGAAVILLGVGTGIGFGWGIDPAMALVPTRVWINVLPLFDKQAEEFHQKNSGRILSGREMQPVLEQVLASIPVEKRAEAQKQAAAFIHYSRWERLLVARYISLRAIGRVQSSAPIAGDELDNLMFIAGDERDVAVRSIIAALGDRDEGTRLATIQSLVSLLGRSQSHAVWRAITAISAGPAVDPVVVFGSEAARAAAADPAVRKLRRLWRTEKSDRVRLAAFCALLMIDPQGGSVEELVQAMKDPFSEIRALAVDVLPLTGPASAAAVPELIGLLGDPVPTVRRRACIALGDVDAVTGAVPALLDALAHDADAGMRVVVVGTLVHALPHDERIIRALGSALSDGEIAVRSAAIGHLASLGPAAAIVREEIEGATNDSSDYVRKTAAKALEAIDGKK
jgi:hypothetical protein